MSNCSKSSYATGASYSPGFVLNLLRLCATSSLNAILKELKFVASSETMNPLLRPLYVYFAYLMLHFSSY